MMDDIIDLELEKSRGTSSRRYAADPEDEDIRRVELEPVEEDPRHGAEGPPYGPRHHGRRRHARRTGPAHTVPRRRSHFAVEVQKTLAVEAYRASVKMAAERGAFPIYDAAKEKDNPMIARIREADPALYEEMDDRSAAATSPC